MRTGSLRRKLGATTGVVLIAVGCGTPIAGPRTGPHRADAANAAIVVNDPPPPVQVECVPPRPRDECVWVDGSWLWAGRRWEWLPGAWVIPPADCYHAKAYSKWLETGEKDGQAQSRLFFFPATWYPNRAGGTCTTPTVCSSATPIEEC